MIDLDDLQKLRICEKCKCVYMPKFKQQSYAEDFVINYEYCEKCYPIKEDK